MAALASGCTPPDAPRSTRLTAAYLRIVDAEDARPTEGRALATLTEAARHEEVFLRHAAVRALGRLERPDLVPEIVPLLDDPAPLVRAEAANALAQAVHRTDGDVVLEPLIARAAVEPDPEVRATLARSIGRSAHSEAGRRRAADALLQLSRTSTGEAPGTTLLGVALGFESLVRRSGGQGISGGAAARLEDLAQSGMSRGPAEVTGRIRSLAYGTLGQARRLDRRLVERMMRDPHETVRFLAPRSLSGLVPAQRPELLRRLLADPSTAVAVEAVRQIGREPRTELYCRYLMAGLEPRLDPAIRITVAQALGRPCPQRAQQVTALDEAAAGLASASVDAWHVPTHALLSLAAIAPDRAGARLPAFVGHPSPFVRAHAARVAGLLRDRATLRALLADAEPNVRTAALAALFDLEGHAVDDLVTAQLDSEDPQLLLTAARLLEGSPAPEAAERALAAFERISAARRETWRDPRRALLARVSELGGPELAGRLEPFLSDYDPLVAEDAAEILTTWTGRARRPTPRPPTRAPVPTPGEYAALQGAEVVLHMRSGGSIVIALLPEAATTNVHRLARLVEQGYLDGLTFHRWAVNFVIQGGSPGANEYQGAGPFSRDEVGRVAHWRGTVGISTRGRDTGDAQIFVNLVDNVRLNHDYTIVGVVVEGLDVVDAVLEGAVIERAEVRRPS